MDLKTVIAIYIYYNFLSYYIVSFFFYIREKFFSKLSKTKYGTNKKLKYK